MKITKYTAQQKAEALELLADKFTSQAISEVLGIPSGTIRRWKSEADCQPQPEQPEAAGLELLNQRMDAVEVALREEIDNLKALMQRLLDDLKNTVDTRLLKLEKPQTNSKDPQDYESSQTRQVSAFLGKKP